MHLKKVIQKRDNLKKIHLKVNSEKNILLISIIKLNQTLNFYVENVLLNKYAIINLSNKFHIKNEFISKGFLTNNKFLNKLEDKLFAQKELWIYLKEEQKYSTDSYSRYEDLILENNKKTKLDLITIGEKAQSFALKNKLNLIKHFDINQKNFSTILASVIKLLYIHN
ncbi:MSC_0622 family F1-like ATPase gamma subunit, partial [Mesomycoplasma hyorhinis]